MRLPECLRRDRKVIFVDTSDNSRNIREIFAEYIRTRIETCVYYRCRRRNALSKRNICALNLHQVQSTQPS